MEALPMSFIVPCNIVVLVNRHRVYLSVCLNNWSHEFNHIVCNGNIFDNVQCKVKFSLSHSVSVACERTLTFSNSET